MKRLIVLVLILASGGAVIFAGVRTRLIVWPPQQQSAEPKKKTLYQCAMHPQIVSDKPDLCPICGMRLEPVDEETARAAPEGAVAGKRGSILFYRHPMRPDVTSPVPAKDEMGMDYIPVYEEEAAETVASNVPGHASFKLPFSRQQLIGVTKARVEPRKLDVEIRAVGRVAYDPELYRAIREYSEAVAAKQGIRESPYPEAQRGADAIIRSAALRLRQLGLSQQQLNEMAEARSDPVNLLLPGKSVWVYAQVYEYEVSLVKPGQVVTITAPSAPGRVYNAKIASVDPILNAATRTVRVRALVSTPDASLRPESFVQVKIAVSLGELLAVPDSAVFDTGEHQFVFVTSEGGRFEPRAVQLGREAQDYYEVLSGLTAGEEVVTSANFLIDSESRFRAAAAAAVGEKPHAQ